MGASPAKMIGTSAPNPAATARVHNTTQNPTPSLGAVKRWDTGSAPPLGAEPRARTAVGAQRLITRCSSPAPGARPVAKKLTLSASRPARESAPDAAARTPPAGAQKHTAPADAGRLTVPQGPSCRPDTATRMLERPCAPSQDPSSSPPR